MVENNNKLQQNQQQQQHFKMLKKYLNFMVWLRNYFQNGF